MRMNVIGLLLAAVAVCGDGQKKPDPKAGPEVGEQAPDFELPRLEGKETVRLADFRDKSPVVLVFGSYT